MYFTCIFNLQLCIFTCEMSCGKNIVFNTVSAKYPEIQQNIAALWG